MTKLMLLAVLFAAACGAPTPACPEYQPDCPSPGKPKCVDGQWFCAPCKADLASGDTGYCPNQDMFFNEAACECQLNSPR